MTIEQLKLKLDEFRLTFFGEDFEWRKGQKEAVIEIVEAYYKGIKTVILDAPVGSGKSIIGMAVAWILNQEGKDGYILASDIALQEQYEKDFNRANIRWGSIKGIDNYLCVDNMEKNSLGTCRIRNKAPNKMPCYHSCPYFNAREQASRTPTSLLNYAYWLIMMNYVFSHVGEEAIFKARDFTICDEGHKLLDLIQNHYSPRFDSKTLEKIEKLTNFFATYKVRNHLNNYNSIKENIEKLYKTENQDTLHEILTKIEESMEVFFPSVDLLKDKVNREYPHEDPPKEWREALWLCDWLKDIHCKVEDYNDIIEKTSTRNMVKNPTGEKELTFNCLEESYMMHKYFHRWTGFTVLMSATFADPSKYLKSIALKEAKYIKMDSLFNFEKSPIYFYNTRRMTYNQIEGNLPWLYSKIDEILDKHPKESGIIHTASYDLTLKIYNGISKKHQKRILIYSGTEEKIQVLEMLKVNKNKVLMGPSLTTGLDLKDDWCRFAIIAKIPYPSLADKFIATKLKINPDWYRWKTIIEVQQAVGRTVRHENDWCNTYILDGALADLIHNNRRAFPYDFLNRIIVCY